VIQQAQSGTGKTATFCSGILQQLDYGLVQCQALVLAPTRELAQQIEKVMRALGDYLGVKVHACVGGTSVREDQRILQAGVHVVVGTPGRVFDMLRRQSLRPDSIRMFVLDEADEMLSRGFKDQVSQQFALISSLCWLCCIDTPLLYIYIYIYIYIYFKRALIVSVLILVLCLSDLRYFPAVARQSSGRCVLCYNAS
jgi:superfamily II DNA/RNA helicase